MASKAKESAAVKRARKKLQKRFDKQDQLVSEKTINLMKRAIHTWISRHSQERIPLEDKSIALFDSNKHPARTKSKFVSELLQKVEKETEESHQLEKLVGRISR